MPRTRIDAIAARVHADYLGDLIRRYKKANRISSDAIGAAMGKTGNAARSQLARGAENFTMSDFKAWCHALNIPEEDAAETLVLYLKQ